jgi:putative photosynthetic complex assembly protein
MNHSAINETANDVGVPKGLLVAAISLVGFSIVASGFARVSDVGTLHMPPSTAVEMLSLRFEDEETGGVAVRNDVGKIIYEVEPGTNGFIRATLRGLVRERKRSGIGDATPFRLTRWSDGAMSLSDETTGRRVNLDAFGPTNAAAFAQLFTSAGKAR